nr:5-formyltetrahydrofolate cyclo-ligase [Marinicella sp. W31]MDC2876071.1 5-formyltetrahydrofolate cyclo-ligase [Marinicella sp. W31]
MNDLPDSKPVMRHRILALRDGLIFDERREKSLALATHGAEALGPDISGKCVAGYHPIRSEVDVGVLMALLEEAGASLALPAVIDRETIVFRAFRSGEDLEPGGFGTLAPGNKARQVDPDILLMPLSVFDEAGNRIGYGAGHYDRAIERLHARQICPLLVGIAFNMQKVPSVPAEPHDVPLNAIITESGFRWTGKEA